MSTDKTNAEKPKLTHFSYCQECGIDKFSSVDHAKEAAQACLEHYREEAGDSGWDDAVWQVCWGEIKAEAKQIDLKERPPEADLEDDFDSSGQYWGGDFDFQCDFKLGEVVNDH